MYFFKEDFCKMKKMRRYIALAISLVMILALVAACGPAAPAPDTPPPVTPTPPTPPTPGERPTDDLDTAPEEGVQLADYIDIILDNSFIAVANPFLPAGNTGPSQWLYTLIYDRLIEEITPGEYGPMLARDWVTEDYQTFRFYLRDDVRFHNGDQFTAEDVAGTIRIAQEHTGSIGHDRWRIVSEYNIIDPFTIELTLANIHIDFLFDISSPPAGIIHEAAFRADPEEGPWIGTGPFRIVEFSTNDFTTVERFDDYWGDAPPTQRLTLRFVPEVAARLVMMQNRESHLSFGTSPEDLSILQADPDFQVIPIIFNVPNTVSFNMSDPLMADPNFRRAVFHALNLEEIAVAAAGDWAVAPIDGNFWGFATPYRLTTIPRWEYNLDLARQYLEASPYNGETIEIAAAITTNIRAAELIQFQLGRIGLVTELNTMDMASIISHVAHGNNQSQMHVFNLSFTLSPYGSAWNVFSPVSGSNRTSFDDPFVTDLIDRARVEPDAAIRRALMEELQEYVAADPPFINLFWRLNAVAAVNGVSGVRLGYDSLRFNLRGVYRVID